MKQCLGAAHQTVVVPTRLTVAHTCAKHTWGEAFVGGKPDKNPLFAKIFFESLKRETQTERKGTLALIVQ